MTQRAIDAYQSAATGLPEVLRTVSEQRRATFEAAVNAKPEVEMAADLGATAARMLALSDFVAEALAAHPALLSDLIVAGDLDRAADVEAQLESVREVAGRCRTEDELKSALRQVRRRAMLRIAWRDLSGRANLDETLTSLTGLADACIEGALECVSRLMMEKEGQPRTTSGSGESRFVVVALGKLGGGELNFSSDVDLVFAYSHDGETATTGLSNHEYFLRLGQRLINVLSEATADGFVFRVDMRLRPNGASGPLALSFDAMEQYYQLHGRTWERYAWIKARIVAGDVDAGQELLERLRPFVYRRYLDYSAIEEIRTMKVAIQSELRRKGIEDNIKLGPGGIREIEFIGQAFQLIRGGRDPRLQVRGIRPVLELLVAEGDLTAQAGAELRDAYEFLRRTENHLQEIADQQLQSLPAGELDRARLADGLNFDSWPKFVAALDRHRRRVHSHFESVFAAPQGEAPAPDERGLYAVWAGALDDHSAQQVLRNIGFDDPEAARRQLQGLRTGATWNALTASGRERLDRLMPLLIGASALTSDGATTLARLAALLEAIARRTVYLSLLIENPLALSQLVKLCSSSEWMAHYLAQHPIVLDELMDPASLYTPRPRAMLSDELRSRLARLPAEDLEMQMDALREFRHAQVLRVAAADLGGGLSPMDVGRFLGEIAETVVTASLDLAYADLVRKHGRPRRVSSDAASTPGFAVIAYGKLGSLELGYTSDLDMVFLHGSDAIGGETEGPRVVANEVFFARLAQRLIHLLTARTSGGILYEVDTRLRPSGGSGVLVTHPAAFRDYQKAHAWVWEHQALIRARPVAGDGALSLEFEDIRTDTLCRHRDPATLQSEVRAMRDRMRAAQPPHDSARFNLKHDSGGMIDVEFMVQYAVLRWAHEHPELVRHRGNISLIEALQQRGLMAPAAAALLRSAYAEYLAAEQRLKLMERQPLVDRQELGDTPDRVAALWQQFFD